MRLSLRNILLISLFLCSLAQDNLAVAPPLPGVSVPAGFRKFLSSHNRFYHSLQGQKSARGERIHLAGSVQRKIRLPVILAAYSDRAGVIDTSNFSHKLFGSYPTGSMKDYYAEVSLGKLSLEGTVYGWFTLPRKQGDYNAGGPLGGAAEFPDSPEGFIAEAIMAADRIVDFGLYDNDGPDGVPNSGDDDGYVDGLIVIHPGGDAASGDRSNLWSHTGELGPHVVETDDLSSSGGRIKVNLYSLLPELTGDGSTPVASEIGVFCHEFGHQLGLPDLYDTNGETGGISYGVGIWDLMGYGTNGADGRNPSRPTHLSAWSRLRLGWAEAIAPDSVGDIALPPVNTSDQVIRVWDNNLRSLSYFLLSYRTKSGFDGQLPGEGLLIWHVDERVFDNNDPTHKLIDLEQADGRDDLDKSANMGDAGDPFPGTADNTNFTASSVPSSSSADGSNSGVAVTGIRIEGGYARFNLVQPGRTDLTISYDENQPRSDRGFGYGDNIAYGAVIFTTPAKGLLNEVSTYFIYPNMDYNLEIYSGADSGRMRCLVTRRSGEIEGSGWRTLELEEPVYLENGDTVVAAVGYRSKGFDDLWPVPYDPTGRGEARSLVSYTGLGAFEPFQYDLTIRAVLRLVEKPEDNVKVLKPELRLRESSIDLGRSFIGESYRASLDLVNDGLKDVPLSEIRVTGSGLETGPAGLFVPCGGILEEQLVFTPRTLGNFAGKVKVTARSKDLSELAAGVSADVVGYSLHYDSSQIPAGYGSLGESTHGAVNFRMTAHGLLCGVRIYLLQDSMRVGLHIWDEARDSGPRCLVTQMSRDTLIPDPGWHQLFLEKSVDIDSADTFAAEVKFSAPGRPFSMLLPVDTLRGISSGSYYNFKEWEGWRSSGYPLAIHALVMPYSDKYAETVLKRPIAALSDSVLLFAGLYVGRPDSGGLWLFNRGLSRFNAAISLMEDRGKAVFRAEKDSLSVPASDSVFVGLTCILEAPGADTSLLVIRTTDKDHPLFEVPLIARAELFELAYDEMGHTATAGFGDTTAWGAVVFTAPWEGVLESIKVYLNRINMSFTALVFKKFKGEAAWEDSVSAVSGENLQFSGWHEFMLDQPVHFSSRDSFAVVASFTVRAGGNLYPLSADTRGDPSGRSWAAKTKNGPWEKLNIDLNMRAGMRAAQFALINVMIGDLDGNKRVDIFDLIALIKVLSGAGPADQAADIDSSGRVDIFDLIQLLKILSGSTSLSSPR